MWELERIYWLAIRDAKDEFDDGADGISRVREEVLAWGNERREGDSSGSTSAQSSSRGTFNCNASINDRASYSFSRGLTRFLGRFTECYKSAMLQTTNQFRTAPSRLENYFNVQLAPMWTNRLTMKRL
jgi:hypothetical protein